jgi:hypothetical protein
LRSEHNHRIVTYDDLCENAILLCLDVNDRFVGFLQGRVVTRWLEFKRDAHTISRRTSPEEKVSPSAFFHTEIPPSVIVGLIAGIVIFVRAFRRAEL